MKYKVLAIPHFNRALKRLIDKYPSLKIEIKALYDQLESDPGMGVFIGNGCYKIRLAISSKGKGKSGGARVITYVRVVKTEVFLLTIYDKSEKEDLNSRELKEFLSQIP